APALQYHRCDYCTLSLQLCVVGIAVTLWLFRGWVNNAKATTGAVDSAAFHPEHIGTGYKYTISIADVHTVRDGDAYGDEYPNHNANHSAHACLHDGRLCDRRQRRGDFSGSDPLYDCPLASGVRN